jgi:hypothetical protein
MARWRKVRHDVLRRRTRLRREMLSWTGEGSHPLAAHWGDAQKHIDSIERRLDQLQREIELLSPPAAGESRNGRETSQHCGPLASAIRDEVYQLCRELSRHYLQQRREAVTDELRQLGRCHAVVVWRLQRLAKLRRRLEHELQAEHALLAPVRGRRHEAADQLRRCENQLRTLNDQRRARDRRSPAEQASRWETRLRELEAIQREIDRRLERLTVRPLDPLRVEEYSSPVESKAMHEASEFLRRLTDGQYVRIHVWRHDRTLRIEDVEGELFSLDASAPASQSIHATPLGPSVRDRVHLALCLALVEAYARRGVHLPLLLADPFRHLNAGQAERLGEVLRDYSARGRQVLVFTDQEQTARVFRRMNIAVRELPLTGDFHHHRVSRWENEPVRIRTGAAALASLEGRPALAARVVEVFTPGSNSHSGTEAHFRRSYLRRSDALEYAPDVDSAAARELTYQGIANVGEFLALSPAAVEQRLSHLRVTAETIRRWQAIARLMCDTPNLRAYDARILAASGVASADELERLAPEELLERVSRCLETDQGRSLFRQGDDDELARLASWVGSGRTTQTLRETQKRHGMKQSA